MAGGGGTAGGTVVQQTAPWAANKAGAIGAQAAQAAGTAATAQMQQAIKAINDSYISTAKTMQPYTQEGVQALNKLNSYLGLSSYDPGKSPTAPTKENMLKDVKAEQVYNWAYTNQKYTDSTPTYIGKDIFGNELTYKNASYITDPETGVVIGHGTGPLGRGGNDMPGPTSGQDLVRAKYNYDAVANILADQAAKDAQPKYDLDKENWDYAKAQQGLYTGPMTAEQISDEITNQPGYQSQLTQGIDAIQKAGSAQGYLGSGRILKELNSWGQNTLSTYYGNTLSRLASLAGAGQQAAQTVAGASQNQGNALAGLYQSLGDSQANSILAGANSLSQGLIAANQQFKTVGGGGGGGGGIGQALGAIGSIASAFSAKHLKHDFQTINTQEILNQVNQLDIEKWKYKGINIDHIGPYAGQFKEVFGVGDGQSINLIDTVGILLASVQELSKKLDKIQNEKLGVK